MNWLKKNWLWVLIGGGAVWYLMKKKPAAIAPSAVITGGAIDADQPIIDKYIKAVGVACNTAGLKVIKGYKSGTKACVDVQLPNGSVRSACQEISLIASMTHEQLVAAGCGHGGDPGV